MFIDAHCHIEYYGDEEIVSVIERARTKGVKVILENGMNPEKNKRVLFLAEKYPELKACLGIYPSDVEQMTDEQIDKELAFIEKNKNNIIAIGEVGLDFKSESADKERQIKTFEKFIRLAIKLDKPIVVHSRKAEKECIELLKNHEAKKVLMHCFSGKLSLLSDIVANGWMISIPTSVKNSEHFQKVVSLTPIHNLLAETDSPFLHPDKELNNEPANVIESYKKIAEIKKMPLKKVEDALEKNFLRLVG